MTLLSIEIPTYNEAENLPLVVERIEALGMEVEIIVVDDNSPDGTGQVAADLAERYGNIKVLRRQGKMGITSAIKDGLYAASGKYVAVIDCDLQHPPEFLPEMMQEAEKGTDVVIASRYVPGGSSSFSAPRRVVSRTATAIAHLLLRQTRTIADPLSGYFIFRRGIINPDDIVSNSYKVLLEILVRGNAVTLAELPYAFGERVNGTSKFGLRETLRYLNLVLLLSDYRVLKLLMIGLAGVAINEGVLFLLAPHTELLAASALAVEASIVASFILNNFWKSGRGRRSGILRKLAEYNTFAIFGALTNMAVLGLLVFVHFEYLAANFIGIMLGFAANSTTNREH